MTPHTPICPTCGQELLLPEEFRVLHLRPNEVKLLSQLWLRKPNVLTTFKGVKESTVEVSMSRIRSALADVGSDWTIVRIRNIGYCLEQKQPNKLSRDTR